MTTTGKSIYYFRLLLRMKLLISDGYSDFQFKFSYKKKPLCEFSQPIRMGNYFLTRKRNVSANHRAPQIKKYCVLGNFFNRASFTKCFTSLSCLLWLTFGYFSAKETDFEFRLSYNRRGGEILHERNYLPRLLKKYAFMLARNKL